MKAMILERICNLQETSSPLRLTEYPNPLPTKDELLIKVMACGVCHTELDEIEGRTPPPHLPIVPGHQAVGYVIEKGYQANRFKVGDRVGIAWIYSACGKCRCCREGKENLCADFRATGRDANGGYAECMTIQENFAFPIPAIFSDEEAAPLLCAGAIGYRSLRLTGLENGQNLGLTGFGGSAHLVLKMVRHQFPASKVFVFARSKDEQNFARELDAAWAGNSEEESPEKLAAIIDTTPVWKPVIESLKNLEPGGRLVINAIRKEEIDKCALMELDYPKHLWMEKEIKSVANVARSDVQAFLQLAAQIPIKPEVEIFALTDANRALTELKMRKIRGSKVLKIGMQ